MKYLPTAFQQLPFAWKLYNYALDGKIIRDELDICLTFKDDRSVLVLPDKIFTSDEDLILACANNLVIAFGAAAITLDRCREESGLKIPQSIISDDDQSIVLIYQIRNAFAHDIAEPKWQVRNPAHKRVYAFSGISVDLSNVSGKHFEYNDIGGIEIFWHLKEYAEANLWGSKSSKNA